MVTVDPRCVSLLELASQHDTFTYRSFETDYSVCKGKSIVNLIVNSLSMNVVVVERSHTTTTTSNSCLESALKAVNILLDSH